MEINVDITGKPKMRIEAGKLIAGAGLFAYRLDILESPANTVTETTSELRSWRERLLSWPWYPWVKEKRVITTRPGDMYLLRGRALVIHPSIYHYLKMALEEGRAVPEIILERHEYIRHNNAPYAVAIVTLALVIITIAARALGG